MILLEISKYKNVFPKDYFPNWSKEIFLIKKAKNALPWAYVINERNGKENQKNQKKKKSRIENVIKRKGDKLYIKWKGYNN